MQTRILNEILELRAELAEYLAEAQQSKTAGLTREVEQLAREQRELDEAERKQREQVIELDRMLASPEAAAEARPQIEALRTQLTGDAAGKIASDRSALAQRESELAARLQRERQRTELLKKRAEQLRTEPSPR